MMAFENDFEVGDEVLFRAAGKVSRSDGVEGNWMPGVVTQTKGRNVFIKKSYDSLVENAVADMDEVKFA